MPHRQTDRWRWHVRVALTSAIAGACRLEQHARKAREQRRPLILGYHRVVEDYASVSQVEMPSMLISQAMFERHIEAIGKSFRFVSLDEIGEHVSSGQPFHDPVAAITFDDGYRDVYENAFPYLKRKGVPFAVFVVTDLIDKPFRQTHDKLYYLLDKAFNTWEDPRGGFFNLMTELDLPATQIVRRGSPTSSTSAVSALLPVLPQADVFRLMNRLETRMGSPVAASAVSGDVPAAETMTWPMIHDMRRAGVTIGSHTRTHVCLPAEKPEDIREELEGSKRILEAELGETIDHFAYPGGHFTPSVVRALHDAGYRYAYTACPHGDAKYPTLTLERLMLWEGSSVKANGEFSTAVFNCQIHDLWPPARRCERMHHV